jgi:cell division protein FtsQ
LSERTTGDDRFKARRLDVERKEGLRRLRLVLGLTAISTLAVGAIAFINSTAFDVDDITVTGAERADTELIIWTSGIELGQGLLDVSLDESADAVELVPWVGTAEVRRSWTGSIEIAVTERGASAVIPAGAGYALVDDHGRQLEIVDQRPDGYLPVSGIEASGVAGEPAPEQTLPVIALLEALPPETERQVSGVAIDGDNLSLTLVDGGSVDFGDGTDLAAKLQAFETVLARVDLTCLSTIDVGVPSAPVVTRLEPTVGGEVVADAEVSDQEPSEVPSQEPDYGAVDC